MKVKLSNTIEVTDEQRAQIGETLGKKQASRDECRDFIWQHGSSWAALLDRAEEYQDELDLLPPVQMDEPEPTLDDLI